MMLVISLLHYIDDDDIDNDDDDEDDIDIDDDIVNLYI